MNDSMSTINTRNIEIFKTIFSKLDLTDIILEKQKVKGNRY